MVKLRQFSKRERTYIRAFAWVCGIGALLIAVYTGLVAIGGLWGLTTDNFGGAWDALRFSEAPDLARAGFAVGYLGVIASSIYATWMLLRHARTLLTVAWKGPTKPQAT